MQRKKVKYDKKYFAIRYYFRAFSAFRILKMFISFVFFCSFLDTIYIYIYIMIFLIWKKKWKREGKKRNRRGDLGSSVKGIYIFDNNNDNNHNIKREKRKKWKLNHIERGIITISFRVNRSLPRFQPSSWTTYLIRWVCN